MKTEIHAQETLNAGKSEVRHPKFETNGGKSEVQKDGKKLSHETTEKTENPGDTSAFSLQPLAFGLSAKPSTLNPQLVLNALASTFKRFVILPPWAAETLALWTVHTYAFEFRDVTTYLGLESPEKRCGKTTLLTVLSELVQRPIVAANISSPALFRVIEETRPTLLIDEADSLLKTNDELRGILNSGYTRKTAYVVRVTHERKRKVAQEDRAQNTDNSHQFTSVAPAQPQPQPRSADFQVCCIAGLQTCPPPEPPPAQLAPAPNPQHVLHEPTEKAENAGNGDALAFRKNSQLSTLNSALLAQPLAFPEHSALCTPNFALAPSSRLAHFTTWCPKVMAAIGRLPDTLADRCIVIRMQRKNPRETCERLRNLDAHGTAADLRKQCAEFALSNHAAIAAATPAIPPDLNDRAADIWEPLFAIADIAGGPWPQLARAAALHLTVRTQDITPMSALFADIILAYCAHHTTRLATKALLQFLNTPPETTPWSNFRDPEPLTERSFARLFRPYGVHPKTIRLEDATLVKGYLREDFQDTFSRYISKPQMQLLLSEEKKAAQSPAPSPSPSPSPDYDI